MRSLTLKFLNVFTVIALITSPVESIAVLQINDCDKSSMSIENANDDIEHGVLNRTDKCIQCDHKNCCCEANQCGCISLSPVGLMVSAQPILFIDMTSDIIEDNDVQANRLNTPPWLKPPIIW